MGTQTESDELIRRLAGEFRVLTLGGLAVIATGLSRNTYDADIWVEPFASPQEAVRMLGRFLTPRVAEAALAHPDKGVEELARKFLHELAEEGDPYAVEILRRV